MPEFNNLRDRVAVVGVGTTRTEVFPKRMNTGWLRKRSTTRSTTANSTKARSMDCSPAGFRATAGWAKS